MSPFLRRALPVLLLLPIATAPAAGQAATRQETVVLAMERDPFPLVPTLIGGNVRAREVTELVFLPLARLGPTNITVGEKDFVPELARSWKRRDSLTLEFEIDPRARWQDGVPVTARDAALALNLARDSTVSTTLSLLLRRIASVTAEGDRRLVVRFSQAYDEQLYDVIYHVSPLPAHLVDTIPPGGLANSAFAGAPVGNGPYRVVRRVPGQQLDLVANDQYLRGKPGPRRVSILIARDTDALINLLLSGTADVLSSLGPVSNVARVSADRNVAIYPVPTLSVAYLLFNQRDPNDLSRPHPILADRDTRAAIQMALNVPEMVQATFGPWATIPVGPVPELSWIRDPSARPPAASVSGAQALLKARGWSDSDGDGVLDRDGRPLSLGLSFPAPSAPRVQLALLVEQQLKQVGVRIELNRLEGAVWSERRSRGNFDIDFSSASMDPAPSGLIQSWGCAGRGGSNVAWYCDPKVDSLLGMAQRDRKASRSLFQEAVRTIVGDVPAVFVYSPTTPYAISRRIRNVEVNPVYPYAALWRWNPGPLP